MHRHIKFHQNRSNGYTERSDLTFYQMATVRNFKFVGQIWGSPAKSIWWSLYVQNLVGIAFNQSISFIDERVDKPLTSS